MQQESTKTPTQVEATKKQPTKLRVFKAPEDLPEKFGVDSQQENHVSGFAKTEDVRELLDAFGLEDRQQIVFPFQHLKKQHGEIWGMRIDPAAGHTVKGKIVYAHHWVYMQHQPERVGAAN